MMLAKAKLALSITFIVLASFTIVTYDRQNMFIIQATGVNDIKLFSLSFVLRQNRPEYQRVRREGCRRFNLLAGSSSTTLFAGVKRSSLFRFRINDKKIWLKATSKCITFMSTGSSGATEASKTFFYSSQTNKLDRLLL